MEDIHYTTTIFSETPTTSTTETKSLLIIKVVKLSVLSLMCVFGTLGNSLLIVTILLEKKLKIAGNFFMVNLSAADLIITAFSIPVIIYNVVKDFTSGVEHTLLCQATAYLKTIALHVSWYSLAFIALNRYYTICRMNEYAKYFKKSNVIRSIILIWMWVIMINTPIMVGWAIPSDVVILKNATSGYYPLYPKNGPPVVFIQSSHDCVLGINDHGGYTFGNGILVMSLPLIAILLCYALVYFAMMQSTKTIGPTMAKDGLKKRQLRERKVSFMLLTVVLIFLICWVPAIVYDYGEDIARKNSNDNDNARLFVNWLALSNSGMNVVLYGLMSRQFRQGYRNTLKRMCIKVVGIFAKQCGCAQRFVDQKSLRCRQNNSSNTSISNINMHQVKSNATTTLSTAVQNTNNNQTSSTIIMELSATKQLPHEFEVYVG